MWSCGQVIVRLSRKVCVPLASRFGPPSESINCTSRHVSVQQGQRRFPAASWYYLHPIPPMSYFAKAVPLHAMGALGWRGVTSLWFQVLTAASMMFRAVFWVILPCKMIVDRRLWTSNISYTLSASSLDGGEWSASRPGRALPPGKGPPVPIVQKVEWSGLDTEARGKILSPLPGIEPRSPGSPVCSQTLYWLSYPARYLLLNLQLHLYHFYYS
jgi:hypothetical protein